MRRKGPIRILALDLHPRCFGYVVVENSSRLLDWGVCSCRRKHGAADVLIQRRLRQLLDLWRPATLVLRNPLNKSQRSNTKKDWLLERIVTEAKNRRIIVRVHVKSSAEQGKIPTKYENARRVAEHFPVLTRELPPKRRAWESEHYRMSIFDAAALLSPNPQGRLGGTRSITRLPPPDPQ
jgi:hypothetical protein